MSRKAIRVAPHFLVWGFLFLFPLLFNDDAIQFRRILNRNWVPLAIYMALFYCNFLYLIDRFLFKRKIAIFILINLLLIIAGIYLGDALRDFLSEFAIRGRGRGVNRMSMFRNGFTLLLSVVVSVAIKATQQWYAEEARRKKIENEHLKSELMYLHYQLQPHFFFNTLNNIYALVEKQPQMAQEAIHQLSKLMRYLLYEAGEEQVLLAKEVQFLKSYVALMKLRLPTHVNINMDLPLISKPIKVVPLLFISLVENAFKHGVDAVRTGFIDIKLEIDAHQMTFCVKNSNFPKENTDKSGSGIGLVNLRKRLNILYPEKHHLNFKTNADTYETKLILHLQDDEN